MTSVLIINKGGDIKVTKIKDLKRELLYKKAGFKTEDNFIKQTTWTVNLTGKIYRVELWARDYGKANTENKYDFPPPVDTNLYFGSCILLNCNPQTGEAIDMSSDLWKSIYNKLFNGFYDINDNDSVPSEDELEQIPEIYKSRDGYLKEGFIVDDEDDNSLDESDEESINELNVENEIIVTEPSKDIDIENDEEGDMNFELMKSDNDLLEDDYSYTTESESESEGENDYTK